MKLTMHTISEPRIILESLMPEALEKKESAG